MQGGARRALRGEEPLDEWAALVRQPGLDAAAARPPRPRAASRAVRAGEPVLVLVDAPPGDDVAAVVVTGRGRYRVPAVPAGERELAVEVPEKAVRAPETVRIWLTRAGLAAGPAVVRVSWGPRLVEARWLTPSRLRIAGDGLGEDEAAVSVLLGGKELRPANLREGVLEVDVEAEDAGRALWVSVRAGAGVSDPVFVRPPDARAS